MKRTVEIFTAGCGVCNDLVALVRSIACPSCEVSIHDMKDPSVAARARALGLQAVPGVVVNGVPARRNDDGGYDESSLRATGIGAMA
jgi:glutaredoxin 3